MERPSGGSEALEEADAPVPLARAARKAGHSYDALKHEIDAGRVRCVATRPHGRGTTILVRLDQLTEDLEKLPRCPVEGCEEPALGPGGHCGEHFSYGGRERAREAERKELDESAPGSQPKKPPRRAASPPSRSTAPLRRVTAR